jgi:signal peptide peptidase SppA
MQLLDVLHSPWAIDPPKLFQLQEIYATHLRGEKIDIEAVEKSIGRPLNNQPKGYEVVDGVAVLPMEGVIARKMNLVSQISGGTSSQFIIRDIAAANADPQVHSIILAIDSPGGTVDGTQSMADAIAGSKKPICSLASGQMCSAAYWAGSAASGGVFITESTTLVGSIGVVATHTDISTAQERSGIKTTEITAGKYKRIASQYSPLTKDGAKSIQEQVDYTYSLFVEAVAGYRGVSVDQVLSDMADGKVFIGQQAIDAGLVDGVSTLSELVAQLNAGRSASGKKPISAGVAPVKPTSTGTKKMDIQTFKADHPQLYQTVLAEGASAERDRLSAIDAQALPGHEKLIANMKADPGKTAGDAAMAIVQAEKALVTARRDAYQAGAPIPIQGQFVSSEEIAAESKETKPKKLGQDGVINDEVDANALNASARQYMASHPGASYLDAIKAVQVGGK